MSVIEIIMGILLVVFSLSIIVVVLLQEGSQKNVGVVTGAADTFMSKNKARSANAFLSRWTKIIAVVFILLVIAINIYNFFRTGTPVA